MTLEELNDYIGEQLLLTVAAVSEEAEVDGWLELAETWENWIGSGRVIIRYEARDKGHAY